jgi:hypothetical protein
MLNSTVKDLKLDKKIKVMDIAKIMEEALGIQQTCQSIEEVKK